MKMKDIIVAMPDLEKSLISEILETMLKKSLKRTDELPNFNKKTDDEKLDWMNNLEIALIQLAYRCDSSKRKINSELIRIRISDRLDRKSLNKKIEALNACKSKYKLLYKLLWQNIDCRIKKPKNGIGVRKGWQIVSLKNTHRELRCYDPDTLNLLCNSNFFKSGFCSD